MYGLVSITRIHKYVNGSSKKVCSARAIDRKIVHTIHHWCNHLEEGYPIFLFCLYGKLVIVMTRSKIMIPQIYYVENLRFRAQRWYYIEGYVTFLSFPLILRNVACKKAKFWLLHIVVALCHKTWINNSWRSFHVHCMTSLSWQDIHL